MRSTNVIWLLNDRAYTIARCDPSQRYFIFFCVLFFALCERKKQNTEFLLVFGFSALRAEKPNTDERKVPCCRRQKGVCVRQCVTPVNEWREPELIAVNCYVPQ
jgi:hypothetical protein